jgi:hypothetical protein
MQINKNIMIQLFAKDGMISERLVQQGGEFYAGPKSKHKGPMRVMFTFEDKDDVTGAIEYLQQLALDAPLRVTGTPGRAKKITEDSKPDNSLDILLEDAKKAAKNNQDLFIKHLRELDFVFLDSDNLRLKIPKTYDVKKRHMDNYQWLIRRSRVAKDPRNDRYDPQLFIGISLFSGRKSKIVVYLYSELQPTLKIAIPDVLPMTFKKTNLIKYPHYMTEGERLKWGIQHRELLNDPKKSKTKFYARWEKDVTVGNELKIKPKK